MDRHDSPERKSAMTEHPTGAAMRVVIVGGVAGGMSTATRLRRLDADASITVLERSGHVSFANCGLPYFVGGLIEEEEDLTLQTPEQLFDRFRLDARVHNEVVAIDRGAHTVTARSTITGAETVLGYDKLVLSMGAAPVRPPIPGYDRVRTLRTVEDAARLALRRRRRTDDRGRDRRRVHRARDGREPRRAGHRRDDRRGHPAGAAAARSGARDPRRRRARRARRPRRDRRDGRIGRGAHGDARRRAGASPPTSWSARSGCGPMSRLAEAAGLDARTERRHLRQRDEPDERSRHLRGRRRRREGRRDLARDVAHRPRERREPPGSTSGRPHRRPAVAPGRVAGNGDRQGVRSGRGDRRVERTAPASRGPAVPSDPLTPVRPRHLLPGRDADGREADLRPETTARSSAHRSSAATASTSGST